MTKDEPFLTAGQFAEAMEVSYGHVLRLAREGRLPFRRRDGEWMILKSEFDAHRARQQLLADVYPSRLDRAGMIYFAQIADQPESPIKIGFTSQGDGSERLDALQTGCPFTLRYTATMSGTINKEHALHERFAAARLHGEWFKPTAELLAYIATIQNGGGK